MADSISDFLSSNAGALISAGMDYLSYRDSSSKAQALSEQYARSNDAAAQALQQGYEQSLGATEKLEPAINSELAKYRSGLDTNLGQYGVDNAAIADQYGANMFGTLGDTEAQYQGGAGNYAGTLTGATNAASDTLNSGAADYENIRTGTADLTTPLLTGGYSQYGQTLDPFVQGGAQSQDYLLQTMGLDPNQLTPGQKILATKYLRDANARVNASGLRGSGRGGVAAVNDGMAQLEAQFYDQNQRRADDAAKTLNSTGYSATGNVATSRKDLGTNLFNTYYGLGTDVAENARTNANQQSNLQMSTGEKLANNAKDLGNKLGELTYTTGQNVADERRKAGEKTSDVAFDTNTGYTKDAFGTGSSLQSGLAQARSDTALGIAGAQAAALSSKADQQYKSGIDDEYSRGVTYNKIGDILAGAKTS